VDHMPPLPAFWSAEELLFRNRPGGSGVLRLIAELLLDAQQLIILGDPVGAGQRTGLDLPATGGNGEIRDGRVLGFARTVRHHRGKAGLMRHLDCRERFGQRADLVHLDQDRIAQAGVNCCSTADGARPKEVEWDIGINHYRVKVGGKWLVVPDIAVIRGPNRLGHAVVWLYHEYEVENYAGVYVRCFIPGPAS